MRTRHSLSSPFLTAGVAVLLAGCTGTRVARIAPEQTVDISGDWNDTDSRLVADTMIADALTDRWQHDFLQAHSGDRPVVVVGHVQNRSTEHINTQTFVQDMVRAFVRSGAVRVVASGEQRADVQAEVNTQQSNAAADTRAQAGAAQGANFQLSGVINTIFDQEGGKAVKYYQVDLQLVNLQTQELVWTGQKKIKKFVQRSGYRP